MKYINSFIENFKSLTNTDRSLVFLMWAYFLSTSSGGIFIDTYIFKYFGEISGLLQFGMFRIFFAFLSFLFIGIYFTKKNLSFKNLFYIGIILMILALILLIILGDKNIIILYIFGAIFGLGEGTFWNGIHTYELAFIKDKKRDFYSSSILIGKNFLGIIFPIISSGLFFAFNLFYKVEAYPILFFIMIISYILVILIVKNIENYTPQKYSLKDIFKSFKRNEIYRNLFFIFDDITNRLNGTLLIVVIIYILKTEVNIGIFQGVISFISVLIIGLLSTKRNYENRLSLFFIFSVLIFFNCMFFSFNITIFGIIVYKIIEILINPGFTISEKVFLMKYMGDSPGNNNIFYPRIIYREFVMTIGRLIFYSLMIFIINKFNNNIIEVIKNLLIINGLLFLITYLFVFLEENRFKKVIQ